MKVFWKSFDAHRALPEMKLGSPNQNRERLLKDDLVILFLIKAQEHNPNAAIGHVINLVNKKLRGSTEVKSRLKFALTNKHKELLGKGSLPLSHQYFTETPPPVFEDPTKKLLKHDSEKHEGKVVVKNAPKKAPASSPTSEPEEALLSFMPFDELPNSGNVVLSSITTAPSSAWFKTVVKAASTPDLPFASTTPNLEK